MADSVITEEKLKHWNLLEEFNKAVAKVAWSKAPHRSLSDRKRKVQEGAYLSLYLFGQFNPVARSVRALEEASRLPRVQKDVCGMRINKTSFSEMQHLVDPQRLEKVFEYLADQDLGRPHTLDARLDGQKWLAQDGTLFRALPRMAWALYGVGPDGKAKGVRMHLTFNLADKTPHRATVTTGVGCERTVLKKTAQTGYAYVGDRNFGGDYGLFRELEAQECSFVFRLRDNAAINVVEKELPVSQSDRDRGVVRQAWVRLGATEKTLSGRVRVIWLQSPTDGPMMLVTNLAESVAPAELVEKIYRWRWQIELFFRWVKYIWGMREHWFAESPGGVQIQLYLTLIAALLMLLHFGIRPNKRMMELLQFYFLGIATAQDLVEGLSRQLDLLTKKSKKA